MANKKPFGWRVVLFEDSEDKAKAFATAFRKELGSEIAVEQFDVGSKAQEATAQTYEDRLVKALKPHENICLIVSDRDISTAKGYLGLSEAVVVKAARVIGVPVGVYATGKTDDVLERAKTGGDGRIVLDASDLGAFAAEVGRIARGMVEMRREIDALWKGAERKFRGPAAVLAHILGQKDIEEHLSLYVRGDQRMVAEFLAEKRSQIHAKPNSRHVATALGIWFFDSVLRFPGVLLDVVAAASFLGVSVASLEQPSVLKVFQNACYLGPFSGPRSRFWWRHLLSELLSEAKVSSGRELLKKKGKRVGPSHCTAGSHSRAGFVCVVTHQAVCDEHSVGQISWLPRGADLARVRMDIFEEIAPWIGM